MPQDDFDELVARLGPRLMGLLVRLTGDPTRAQDVYQDTWLAVFRRRRVLRRDRDPWGYVRTVAVRRALLVMRRDEGLVTGGDPEPEAPGEGAGAVPLEALPPRERVCLVLYFLGGLSVREVAEHLKVPEGTVKSRMRRGRTRLRDALLETEER